MKVWLSLVACYIWYLVWVFGFALGVWLGFNTCVKFCSLCLLVCWFLVCVCLFYYGVVVVWLVITLLRVGVDGWLTFVCCV